MSAPAESPRTLHVRDVLNATAVGCTVYLAMKGSPAQVWRADTFEDAAALCSAFSGIGRRNRPAPLLTGCLA